MLKWKSLLTLPYLSLYLALAVAVNWIYIEYEEQSIHYYEMKITSDIGERVQTYLNHYFSVPELLVKSTNELIRAEYLDAADLSELGRYFTAQIKTHPGLTYLSFGSDEGEYVGARYLSKSDRVQMITSYKKDNYIEMVYEINTSLNHPNFVQKGEYYDSRTSIWYQTAEQAGERSWYPVYKYEFLNTLGMGISDPVYDQANNLLGVITADVALSRISDFLSKIPIDINKLVFLVDQQGYLIATSNDEPIFDRQGNQIKRLRAEESEHPLIRTAGHFRKVEGNTLTKKMITVDGERYWIDEIQHMIQGLEISIVIMIPEKEITDVMKRPTTNLAIALLITMVLGAIVGGILSKYVTNRIKRLENEINCRNDKLEKANAELQKLAITDPVTGIFNRRYFDHFLRQQWRGAVHSQQPLTLLICDIDYFKRYNDSQGHLAGDKVLADIANILEQHALRFAGIVARYGGEEFAMVLPNTNKKEAFDIAQTIMNAVNKISIPHKESKVTDHVTISTGGATIIPSIEQRYEELIQLADEQLYLAKDKGRNCVMIYGISGLPKS